MSVTSEQDVIHVSKNEIICSSSCSLCNYIQYKIHKRDEYFAEFVKPYYAACQSDVGWVLAPEGWRHKDGHTSSKTIWNIMHHGMHLKSTFM